MEPILLLFLKKLGTKHTSDFISEFLKTKADPSSPQAIAGLLDEYQIESMTVRFTSKQLEEVTYPILALVRVRGQTQYVVLTQLVGGLMTYLDSTGKEYQEPVEDFEKTWTGMAILVDTANQRQEPGLRGKVVGPPTGFPMATLIAIVLMAYPILALAQTAQPGISISFFLLDIAGMYVMMQLIKESVGLHSEFSKRFCKIGPNTDCSKVLSSSASSFAGLQLADMGFLFFAYPFLLLTFFPGDNSALDIIHTLTALSLPVAAFSLYYQWRVVKTWCPLCLMAVGILALQFAIMMFHPFQLPSAENILVFGLIFLAVAYSLYRYKKEWLEGQKGIQLARRFETFKNDPTIRVAIMENGETITDLQLLEKLELSSPGAKNELIIVTGLACLPCSIMHEELKYFLDYFRENLSVKIIPSLSSHDRIAAEASLHMINILVSERPDKEKAIHAWFGLPEKTEKYLQQWKNDYPSYDQVIDPTPIAEWLETNKLNHTPCFILNNRKVNEEYQLKDIRQYLKRKIK